VALPRVHFDRERCRAAAEGGYAQATDLAEALVTQGVPFREAYQAVGALVRRCQEQGLPLSAATLELARGVDPRFNAEALKAADPRASAARKESPGGTGPASLEAQLTKLKEAAALARSRAAAVPRLENLFRTLKEAAP
jgi:argininosuccinate lyase